MCCATFAAIAPHIPFKEGKEWNAAKSQLSGTVHCNYPAWVEFLCHDISWHVPHHVSSNIPWCATAYKCRSSVVVLCSSQHFTDGFGFECKLLCCEHRCTDYRLHVALGDVWRTSVVNHRMFACIIASRVGRTRPLPIHTASFSPGIPCKMPTGALQRRCITEGVLHTACITSYSSAIPFMIEARCSRAAHARWLTAMFCAGTT
jgi:hypothetical protein